MDIEYLTKPFSVLISSISTITACVMSRIVLLWLAGEAGEQLCLHRLCHHGAGGPGPIPGPQPGHSADRQASAAQELCFPRVAVAAAATSTRSHHQHMTSCLSLGRHPAGSPGGKLFQELKVNDALGNLMHSVNGKY